jgi:1-acyl-sn-glycerol-3-phosphate acyltransferase
VRIIYRLIFYLRGWKIEGDVPRDIKKYIIVVAPHTSNWDFLIGVAVRSIKKFKSNFLGKKELFKPPFGWLFYGLGGFPVDRQHKTNLVDQVIDLAKNNERFVIAITPEGTRKSVAKWKTGFYQIAFGAQIPIVFCSLDYKKKLVFFNLPFYPTGDFVADAPTMAKYYEGVVGKTRGITPII